MINLINSGEINNKELEALLIKRYIKSIKNFDYYGCFEYDDFNCKENHCSNCDFSEERMKARYDNYISSKNKVWRIPAKKDKQYRSTLKQLRGYNE